MLEKCPPTFRVMANESRDLLLRQFDTASKLLAYHLDGLTTDECLWRPASRGPHVYPDADHTWRADWPDSEAHAIGPPSIAWLTWHITFWWSMAFDHSFADATLSRDSVVWPGDAAGVRQSLGDLDRQWRLRTMELGDDDLRNNDLTRWPFRDRPFGDVVAWVNVELTKNAAEIGYARFLYAARDAR